jgi:hypothetical protein
MRIGPVEGKGFEIAGMNSVEWCQYASETEAGLNRAVLIATIIDPASAINQGFRPESGIAKVININESMAQAVGSLKIIKEDPFPNHKTWTVDPIVKPTRGRPRKAE